eukprot:gene10415-2546_t
MRGRDIADENDSGSASGMKTRNSDNAWRDCLECKIAGTVSLTLAGGYLLYSRRQVPLSSPRLRLFMSGMAYGLFGLAAIRASM